MSANNKRYTLASLIPEPLTFEDRDGTVYEVKRGEAFSAVDWARLEHMQRELPKAMEAAAADPMNIQAEQQANQHIDGLMRMLIPDMPLARIQEIGFADKMGFFLWWKGEQTNAQAEPGEAPAGKVASRKRRRRK
jgi:hypothetical protein